MVLNKTGIIDEAFILDKKVNYIHYNPVEEQIVENAEDYLYSLAGN